MKRKTFNLLTSGAWGGEQNRFHESRGAKTVHKVKKKSKRRRGKRPHILYEYGKLGEEKDLAELSPLRGRAKKLFKQGNAVR